MMTTPNPEHPASRLRLLLSLPQWLVSGLIPPPHRLPKPEQQADAPKQPLDECIQNEVVRAHSVQQGCRRFALRNEHISSPGKPLWYGMFSISW
jgi:hypothetical protein